VFARCASLARHELAGGWRLRDAYLPGVRAVTREAVRDAAARYLVPAHRTTAILVPTPAAAAR
jgi:predicted Zn-dependent peptidase